MWKILKEMEISDHLTCLNWTELNWISYIYIYIHTYIYSTLLSSGISFSISLLIHMIWWFLREIPHFKYVSMSAQQPQYLCLIKLFWTISNLLHVSQSFATLPLTITSYFIYKIQRKIGLPSSAWYQTYNLQLSTLIPFHLTFFFFYCFFAHRYFYFTSSSFSDSFISFYCNWASVLAQTVKNLPSVQETQVQSLGGEESLEKGMATHSSILARRIPWTEGPGGLQSMGLQSVGHDSATNTFTCYNTYLSNS